MRRRGEWRVLVRSLWWHNLNNYLLLLLSSWYEAANDVKEQGNRDEQSAEWNSNQSDNEGETLELPAHQWNPSSSIRAYPNLE
jgi:hypothetical protein